MWSLIGEVWQVCRVLGEDREIVHIAAGLLVSLSRGPQQVWGAAGGFYLYFSKTMFENLSQWRDKYLFSVSPSPGQWGFPTGRVSCGSSKNLHYPPAPTIWCHLSEEASIRMFLYLLLTLRAAVTCLEISVSTTTSSNSSAFQTHPSGRLTVEEGETLARAWQTIIKYHCRQTFLRPLCLQQN